MPSLTVSICGRSYDIGCEEGQEEHVIKLAHAVDRKAQDILQQVGPVGEARLLVMLCLVLQDELAEMKPAAAAAASGGADLKAEVASAQAAISQSLAQLDGQVAGSLESLAARVEAIADRLAKS